jgi:hypothetical protein
MAESNATNNNSNNENAPTFVDSINSAANATVNYVNDSLTALKKQKTQDVIDTVETEKAILDINTDKFATTLNSYNNIIDNYPIADGNLDAYDAASKGVKDELLNLTNQINEALNAYTVAKKNEISENIEKSKNEQTTGGRRMSKKRLNKKNKRRKSNKHRR